MIHAPAPVLPSAGMRPTSLVGAPYMHLGDANGFLVQGQGLVESTYRA